MEIPTTHTEALRDHPDAVRAVLARRFRGKSRARSIPPDRLEWSYIWSETIEAPDLFNFLARPKSLPKEPRKETADEEFERRRKNLNVGLRAKHGRAAWTTSSWDLSPIPAPIEAFLRKTCEERVAAAARFAALSPEERDGELREALAYLMGPKNKGFVALRIPVPKK